jgi:hypothetical protein
MTTPSHCFDQDSPIRDQLTSIKDQYDDILVRSHKERDQDDWDTANADAGLTGLKDEVKRPTDKDFLKSSFYEDYVVGYSDTLFTISTIEPILKKVQAAFDAAGVGARDLGGISYSKLKDYETTDPASLAGPTGDIYLVQDFQAELPNLISALESIPCPSDLQVAADDSYVNALAEAIKEAFIKVETAKQIAAAAGAGAAVGPGGTTLRGTLITPEQIARIEADAVLAAEALKQKLRKKIASEFIAEKRLIQEQCFILSQISTLINYKRENFENRLPYVEKDVVRNRSSAFGASEKTKVSANAPILIQGQPFAFMNKVIQYPTTHKLFDLTTAQLSSLVPTIRLYKIATDPKTGKDIGDVEITFDTNPAVESYEEVLGGGGFTMTTKRSALDLFKNKRKRGYGVGLQGFDFTFHGSDPFAVKKAIQAKLSIFATSFGDLIQERGGYKYADLALKTGSSPEDIKKNLLKIQQQNLDKLNFRLKAVVGWAIPSKDVGSFNASEKDAVSDSFVTLNLTPTIHEFNFDEMGGVSFVINYLAYIEDYFNQSIFNVFSDPQIERTRIARKLFFEFLDTQSCDEASLKVIKEASASVMQQEKNKSFRTILKSLQRYQRILNYNISDTEIDEFLRTGKIDDKSKLVPTNLNSANRNTILNLFKTYNSSFTTEEKRRRIINLTKSTREQNILSFFYISDLLDVIMENIDNTLKQLTSKTEIGGINYLELLESSGFVFDDGALATRVKGGINVSKEKYAPFVNGEQVAEFKKSLIRAKKEFKKLRIVLGPVEIVDPFNRGEVTFCSIGDLPLSLNYFTEFLTQKMLSKQEVFYPLTNFVKDLVNEVIKNFLNNDSCFDFSIRQKLKLNSSTVTGHNFYPNNTTDDITYAIRYGKKSRPLIKTSGPERSPVYLPDSKKEINYYIFYAGRSYPLDFMTGDRKTDNANGIFHYILGKDRGIVKNITLDKTDMKGLKELRFEKEGFDGLTQLREVYNANIDCFLNVQAYPGMYIYIDPRGFSPEAGINYSQFGIGGYYMITRAEHSIGVGKADTKIIAKWVADTNGRVGDTDTDGNVETEEDPALNKPRKCVSKARSVSFRKSLSKKFAINSIFDLYKLSPLGAAVTAGQALAETDE